MAARRTSPRCHPLSYVLNHNHEVLTYFPNAQSNLFKHTRLHRRREQRPLLVRSSHQQRFPRRVSIHRRRGRRPAAERHRGRGHVLALGGADAPVRVAHPARVVEGRRVAREVGDEGAEVVIMPVWASDGIPLDCIQPRSPLY